MIRPELAAALARWHEVISAAGVALLGLWFLRLGGYVFGPLGGALVLVAAGWTVIALRRLRFLRPVTAPGLVEVDEGQVGYFGPTFGGMIALSDLSELRLCEWHGARQWRLATGDGQVLLIPTEAQGAERLHDAFATLPGIDMAALARSLTARAAPLAPLWTRAMPPVPLRRIHHENSSN